jgi:hypothetical protein
VAGFGYHVALLSWQPHAIAGRPIWAPRSGASDTVPGSFPRTQAYPAAYDERIQRVMEQETAAWCGGADAIWQLSRDSVAAQIPTGLRERSLVLLMGRSSYYTSHLTGAQRRCREAFLRRLAEYLQSAGYNSLVVGEKWTDRDFVDYVHPSATGGRKLARQIAPLVRELAGR